MVQSPQSEALGGAQEGLNGGSSAALLVYGRDRGGHSVQVKGSYVVEVGRETGCATETLLGRVEVVAEGDGYCVGVIG